MGHVTGIGIRGMIKACVLRCRAVVVVCELLLGNLSLCGLQRGRISQHVLLGKAAPARACS